MSLSSQPLFGTSKIYEGLFYPTYSRYVMRKENNKAGKTKSSAEVNCDRVMALTSRLRKLCDRDPEYVRLLITDEVSLSAEYSGGRVTVYDREAVVTPSDDDVDVRVPTAVIKSTLNRRGKVSVSMKGNLLTIRDGSKYKADLHVEVPEENLEFESVEGQDASPLVKMLAEVAPLLVLRESATTNAEHIDVHFEWDKAGITAAVADEYHGVIVEGPASSKKQHRVTLPLKLARKLAEIGGKFSLGETRIQAQSEVGHVDLAQVAARDSVIPFENIVGLLDQPVEWTGEFLIEDLATLMNNLAGTEDGRNEISFVISKNDLTVKSRSAFGAVEGKVEVTTVKGTPPGSVDVRPSVFDTIALKMKGPVRMSKLQGKNVLRLEPKKQRDWTVYGFVVLLRQATGKPADSE